MANLIIQDTFDPYYAGRDEGVNGENDRRNPSPEADKRHGGQIVLPCEAPAPPARVYRDRRAVAH